MQTTPLSCMVDEFSLNSLRFDHQSDSYTKGTDKKTLERLNGRLEHASVAVYPGKARLRNLQHALHLETRNYDDKIILDDVVIQDLLWWRYAIKHMNGIPMTWVFQKIDNFDEEVWADASLRGNLIQGGMGGCTRSGTAYQIRHCDTQAYYVSLRRHGICLLYTSPSPRD